MSNGSSSGAHPSKYTPPFLAEVIELFDKYLESENYEATKDFVARFPNFTTGSEQVTFYIHPVNFPKDRSSPAATVTIQEDGSMHCSVIYYWSQAPVYTLNFDTNVHKPDSFLEVKKFLDRIFANSKHKT